MKHTVINNNGEHINFLIKNSLCVPTLHTQLLTLQKLAQKSEDKLTETHILGDALHLRWDLLSHVN